MKPATTVTSKTVTVRIPKSQFRTNSTQVRGNSNDNKNNNCDLQGIGNIGNSRDLIVVKGLWLCGWGCTKFLFSPTESANKFRWTTNYAVKKKNPHWKNKITKICELVKNLNKLRVRGKYKKWQIQRDKVAWLGAKQWEWDIPNLEIWQSPPTHLVAGQDQCKTSAALFTVYYSFLATKF